MELMDPSSVLMDNLLDFSSDIGEDEEEEDDIYHHNHPCRKTKNPSLPNFNPQRHHLPSYSLMPPSSHFPEYVEEEELEWISNKDAFPMVESFVDIIPNHPSIAKSSGSHLSAVSVLENSSSSMSSNGSRGSNNFSGVSSRYAVPAMLSMINTSLFKVPGKARSKQLRKRRRDMLGEQWQFIQEKVKQVKPSSAAADRGRKCLHCGSDKTPQWRLGPLGPKTLCNACGVRYKSGRLVPEYRPANSPSFRVHLHSNSHRKVIEMRRQKMMTTMGSDAGFSPGAADIGLICFWSSSRVELDPNLTNNDQMKMLWLIYLHLLSTSFKVPSDVFCLICLLVVVRDVHTELIPPVFSVVVVHNMSSLLFGLPVFLVG